MNERALTPESAPASSPGYLIVFEGIDGTGKSTQIRFLRDKLREWGHEVCTSFEPTKGQWGSLLRASMTEGRLSPDEELELFLKDRREHVSELIEPMRKRGVHVLLDRYYFSTMAYQGARGYDPSVLRERNETFAPRPDLVIWLDISVETALERIGGRGEANEFEQAESLRKCRDIFAGINEDWFVCVDASSSPEEVACAVEKVVLNHLFSVKD